MIKYFFITVATVAILLSCSKEEELTPYVQVTNLNHVITDGDTLNVSAVENQRITLKSNYGRAASGNTVLEFTKDDNAISPSVTFTGNTEGSVYEDRFEVFFDWAALDCESNDVVQAKIYQSSTNISFHFWIKLN